MKSFRAVLLVAAVTLVFVTACGQLGDQVTLVCRLPTTPDRWRLVWGQPSYEVSWLSPAGTGTAEGPLLVTSSEFVLTVPRVGPVSIIATPVWSNGPATLGSESLYPAGAVWPLHWQGDTLDLSFVYGPLVTLVADATRAGVPVHRLNLARLEDEIATRIGSDPWRLDQTKILRALVDRSMRITAIKPVEVRETGLSAPSGVWYWRSPFRDPVATGSQLLCPEGVSVLYSGDGRRLVVTVDSRGRAWMSQPEAPAP